MKTRITAIPFLLGSLLCLPTAAMAQDEGFSTDDAILASSDDNTNNDVIVADDSAQKSDDAKKDDDKKDEDDKSWAVTAKLAFDLGLGAFVKDEHARKVRSRMTFEFGGSYTIPVIDVDVAVSTGFSQWLSKAGDSNGKHAFRWSDTTLDLSREIWSIDTKVMKTTDLSFGISFDLGFVFPTSQASITTKLYTQIVPALSLSFKLDKLSLGYTIAYGHNFHKYTSQALNPDDVDVLSRRTGNELIGSSNIAVDGVLTEIELANMFTVGYSFIDQLSLGIGLGFVDAWTYDNGTISKKDELTSEYAHVGRGHSQMSQGIVALTYVPIKYVSVALSMVSTQPWKTADNKTLRFPWFDTVSPSKNYTKFMLSATFQY